MQGADAFEPPREASRAGSHSPLLRRVLFRRLWLPPSFYAAIPWIYLGAGSMSLLGGLFLPGVAWLFPYLLLLGCVCLHAGVAVASMRQRSRKRLDR
jgi:hypothetical protein